MQALLFLIPTLPLAGSITLGFLGPRLSKGAVAWVGVGSIGLSTVATLFIAASYLSAGPPGHVYTQTLWTWFDVAGLRPEIRLWLDPLSLVMSLVVTSVGFLIHLYSAEFMREEEGYSRFFAYMNLFVASMLTLVLADHLLFLYLGWEGVGLCSYLLIGFWYRDPANGRAARKAFLVTRVGDTAMAIGFFLLFKHLGTLQIQPLMHQASTRWAPGSGPAVAASALLLGGALGKSAQLPLQTWLPDAMAGPTPVSALIHAATMVTAGVYLIARTHALFTLAPPVQLAVAVIGALTLLLAAFSALAQSDIKRILAYSTISQIGYMFLALGVGAWSAAIFHFMTHAFFKALLFLAAGAVILAMREEHDIFKMGGLRKQIPAVFWTSLIGAASLSALPWITAGFYSKDLILSEAYASPLGSAWLWAAGLVGAFLTSLYSFRLIFVVFFGETRERIHHKPGPLILVPLVVLAILSVIGGFVDLPPFLETILPAIPGPATIAAKSRLPAAASLASVAGIALAYWLYVLRPGLVARATANPIGGFLHRFWFSGWGFDRLHDFLFVRPYVLFASTNRDDAIDLIFDAVARINLAFHRVLSGTQTGKVRWYAAAIAGGAAVVIALTEVL